MKSPAALGAQRVDVKAYLRDQQEEPAPDRSLQISDLECKWKLKWCHAPVSGVVGVQMREGKARGAP